MYRRSLDGKTLTFGHEGILYRRSFLMYDKGTHSLWVHTTGQAVKGKLKGKSLPFVPCIVTTWGQWKMLHPRTTVLEGGRASPFMGTFRLKGKGAGYGLAIGQNKKTKLYPYAALTKQTIINDTFNKEPVAVYYDQKTRIAVAWKRGERKFKIGAKGVEDANGKQWDLLRGRATDGSDRMVPVVATAWLIERWRGFFPKGTIYGR